MNGYIVYSINMRPAAVKGQLPDLSYTYIANDSNIGWHYTITRDRERAYIFDESEMSEAEFIASCWGMKLEKLN